MTFPQTPQEIFEKVILDATDKFAKEFGSLGYQFAVFVVVVDPGDDKKQAIIATDSVAVNFPKSATVAAADFLKLAVHSLEAP